MACIPLVIGTGVFSIGDILVSWFDFCVKRKDCRAVIVVE